MRPYTLAATSTPSRRRGLTETPSPRFKFKVISKYTSTALVRERHAFREAEVDDLHVARSSNNKILGFEVAIRYGLRECVQMPRSLTTQKTWHCVQRRRSPCLKERVASTFS